MPKEPIAFAHIFFAVIPMALTPALMYALAEGWIDLGGGEKDILMALPYFVMTLIFFISGTTLILKRWDLRSWLVRSAIISVSLLLGLWLFACVASVLGMA